MSNPLSEQFVQHLHVEKGLSKATVATYRYQVLAYLRFLDGRGRGPGQATREDILAYIGMRREVRIRSSSLFTATMAIRQFHRFLRGQGLATGDPTEGLPLPRPRQNLPQPLSQPEIARLMGAPTGNSFREVRDRAVLELLYATGMRISELLGLKADQFDEAMTWVRVAGKGGKERILPISPRAHIALLQYLAVREQRFGPLGGAIFLNFRGSPITRGGCWWRLRCLAQRAGIEHFHPHRIRHSAGTHMLEGGADIRVIQQYLGHRSLAPTIRYTHVTPELLRKSCNMVHPGFSA